MKLIILIVSVFVFLQIQINAQEYYDEYDLDFNEDQEEELSRVRRQLFGGRSNGPGRSFSQNLGYKHGNTWGSISQSADGRGRMSPISYGGGSGFNLPGGHSITGSIDHFPKFGSQASVRGTANVFSNDRHQVSAWAQHDRNFARNWKPVGKETNSAGLNYAHSNGATAFLSGSRTPGSPVTGSAGGTIPIVNLGSNARVEAVGQTNFGKGLKPDHQVGVQVSAAF